MSGALRQFTARRQVAGGNVLDNYTWEFRFEADSITGLSDNDPVATWPDLSGNGRDATQATPSDRPTYKTGIINGLPAVRYPGGTDVRLATAAVSAISQPTTTFYIGFGEAGARTHFDGIVSSARHTMYGPATTYMYAGGVISAGLSSQAFALWCIIWDGASSKVWRGGGSGITGDLGTHTLTGLTIGNRFANSESCGGDVAAVLFAAGSLAVTDINTIANSLADKYNLTWSTAT